MGEARARKLFASAASNLMPVPRRWAPRVEALMLLVPQHAAQDIAATYRQLVAQRTAQGKTTVALDEFRVELLCAGLEQAKAAVAAASRRERLIMTPDEAMAERR